MVSEGRNAIKNDTAWQNGKEMFNFFFFHLSRLVPSFEIKIDP